MQHKVKQTCQTKTKKGIGKSIIYVLLFIASVLLFTAPLAHMEFSKVNLTVKKEKKALKERLITPLEAKIAFNRVEYDLNNISAINYIKQNDVLVNELKKAKKKYTNLSKTLVDKYRVFGWKTLRMFLIGFGIRLPFLLFSIIISFLILKINTNDSNLKRSFVFLQIASYTISFYVLVWCFWYSQDYPLSSYRWVVIGISVLASISTVYFIKYRKLLEHRYSQIIKGLFDFILSDLEDEDMIKEEKIPIYKEKSISLLKNALDNE